MIKYRQDWRWNADNPSATLDPYIPTWLTTSPALGRQPIKDLPIFLFLNIEMKFW